MKKIVLIFLFIISLTCSNCFAFDPDPIRNEVVNIPQYKEYFEDFAQRLYNDFQPRKHFIGVAGTYGIFNITVFRDGTVKNIQKDFIINRNKYIDYCEKIITELEPKPFPPEIKDDFIVVDLVLGYYNEDKIKILLYGKTKYSLYRYWQKLYNVESVNLIDVRIEKKNYLHKLW